MLKLIAKLFPVVGQLLKVHAETQEAILATQRFAKQVEQTASADPALKVSARALINEWRDVQEAIAKLNL
jgi:hypothetical protein